MAKIQPQNDNFIEKICKGYFKKKLRGKAAKWYRNILEKKRQQWKDLKAFFKTRFKSRPIMISNGVVAKVNLFGRRIYKTMVEYIKRADEIVAQCPYKLQKELKNKFLTHLTNNG